MGSTLKRSCRGLSGVGGGANRKYLLFVFVEYIICRTVDKVTADSVPYHGVSCHKTVYFSSHRRSIKFFMRVREPPKGILRVFVQFQFILPTKKNKTKQKTSIQKHAEAMW